MHHWDVSSRKDGMFFKKKKRKIPLICKDFVSIMMQIISIKHLQTSKIFAPHRRVASSLRSSAILHLLPASVVPV